jgi:hypothetical protein
VLAQSTNWSAAASGISATKKDITMPRIARQPKHAREAVNVRLDVRIFCLLKGHTELVSRAAMESGIGTARWR